VILACLASIAGVLVAAATSWFPGIHVYNLLGMLLIWIHRAGNDAGLSQVLLPFVAGLIVGYVVFSTLPTVLLSVPDESAMFTVMPAQRYVLDGRAMDAVILTGGGALVGAVLVVVVVGLLGPRFLPIVRRVLDPHMHWILWCAVAFMIMSEWPKETGLMQGGWRRLAMSWRSTGAGLLAFALSGWLGFVLFYKSPVPAFSAFQNLAPAFAGLFTMPWLLTNMVSRVRFPEQGMPSHVGRDPVPWLQGALVGLAGGGMAAFMPVVTGGLGSFLAGHASGARDDRTFLVSQGVSRMVYYAGGFLLLVMPGVFMTRGGAAWMVRGVSGHPESDDYWTMLTAIALSSAVAALLLLPMTGIVMRLVTRFGYRWISAAAAVVTLAIVVVLTGWGGLVVLAVSTLVGLIPVACGTRRLNLLGILLVPMGCRLSGVADRIAGWMGLL